MRYPSRSPDAVADRHAEVERLTRAGLKIREICQATGLSRTSVVRIRGQRGLARQIRTALSPSDVARAQEFLNDGAPIAEVVRTLGCGRSQIDARFPDRAWSLRQSLDHLQALRRFAGNHSADQIEGMWRKKRQRQIHHAGGDTRPYPAAGGSDD